MRLSPPQKAAIRKELLLIHPLTAKGVVEYARTHTRSMLHRVWPWDVNRAAYQHWLEFARDVIKTYYVSVTVVPRPKAAPVNVTVAEFQTPGHTTEYRTIAQVMRSRPQRDLLLEDTKLRLRQIKEVWIFPELAAVAAEIDKLP
jgi:hypothetical protein